MIIINQCNFCLHYQGAKDGNEVCLAFPEGIPDILFANEFDHRQSYVGDNGIQFEPVRPAYDNLQRELFDDESD